MADKPIYDRLAPHYEPFVTRLDRWYLSELRARTLAALPQGGRLLEVGAGTGLNFKCYPRNSAAVASDLSGEMLKIAQEKQPPPNTCLIQANAENLPFADDSFDAAFATLVFCSVKSPEAGFSEIRRVVKKGGTVALLEHVRPDGLLGPVFDLLSLCTVALLEDHFNRRTAEIAEGAGLKLLKVEKRLLGILNLIVCKVEK